MKNYSSAVSCFMMFGLLAGCGGSGSLDGVPRAVEPNANPVQAVSPASEQQAGSFKGFFAQMDIDDSVSPVQVRPFVPGKAAVLSDQISVFVDDEDPQIFYVAIQNSAGGTTIREYRQDGSATQGNPKALDYEYSDNDGQGGLSLRRWEGGVAWGRIRDGNSEPFPGTSLLAWDTYGTFLYGWPVDRAALAASGIVSFASPTGGTLLLSDGRNIQGGSVDLTADFANASISGTVFRRTSDPDAARLEAELVLTNGTIKSDGSISASDALVFTHFKDTSNPGDGSEYSGVNIAGSTLEGQFVGMTDKADAIGAFSGDALVSQANGGTAELGFSGLFHGIGN